MAVKSIPEGYNTISHYLAVDDAGEAIEYYKRAFDATERGRMNAPDGRVAHAELQIGDSVLMLADPFDQSSTKPPKELGGASAGLFMYVEDVDGAFQQAVDAGATATMPPEDMFWGDRFSTLTDPFGHVWNLATHIEDPTREEIEERARQAMAETS
jgi:PhnB protein